MKQITYLSRSMNSNAISKGKRYQLQHRWPITTVNEFPLLEEQGRVGQAGLTYEVQRILKKFKPTAMIKDVNFRFLESFEYWLRNERKNKDTTISVKMPNLQRVINQAIEDKLMKQEDYPFGEKKYSINKRLDHRTKKRAIHLDKIRTLSELRQFLTCLTGRCYLLRCTARMRNN